MAQESVTIALFQSKSFFQAFLESSVIFLPHTSSFKDILCHETSCLTSRSRLGNWVLNHSPKDSLKWKCFTRLSLTFTHKTLAVLLPFYFLYLSSPFITLCALSISSKKPQDVNLPYVSYSFFKKKKISHFLLFWGGPYCWITLWSNSDQLYLGLSAGSSPEGRPWPLPSDRLCVLKLLCQLGASVQDASLFKYLCRVVVSRA